MNMGNFYNLLDVKTINLQSFELIIRQAKYIYLCLPGVYFIFNWFFVGIAFQFKKGQFQPDLWLECGTFSP